MVPGMLQPIPERTDLVARAIAAIHTAQMLPYLKLSTLRLDLLINFNVRMIRDGIRRVAL